MLHMLGMEEKAWLWKENMLIMVGVMEKAKLESIA